MKIGYIYDAVYPWVVGGAEKRVFEITKRLSSWGHEVHWFGLQWWEADRDLISNGVYLHGLGKYNNMYSDGRRSIGEGIYFALKTFQGLNGNFDILDCQQSPYFHCFPVKYHSVLNNYPVALTWYELWGDYWYNYLGKKGLLGKMVEKCVLRLPNRIIANSPKIKNDLIDAGIKSEKICVSPNGIELEKIKRIERKNEEFDVLYAGRLIEHKNIDYLIKSIAIARENISDIKCGIIGDGPEKQRLVELAKNLKLDNNIKFMGFLETEAEVISYMKSSKIFAIPSSREGSPVSVIEANACGLPVITIANKNNGTTSLIRNNENGFICELSPQELSNKISDLLLDPNRLKSMRTLSIDYSQRFDWDVITENLLNIYKTM